MLIIRSSFSLLYSCDKHLHVLLGLSKRYSCYSGRGNYSVWLQFVCAYLCACMYEREISLNVSTVACLFLGVNLLGKQSRYVGDS
jgi:hypothetical protein